MSSNITFLNWPASTSDSANSATRVTVVPLRILLFGTTFDIMPAVNFDGHPIGSGRPGQIYHLLRELLEEDIRNNKALHTPVFDGQ